MPAPQPMRRAVQAARRSRHSTTLAGPPPRRPGQACATFMRPCATITRDGATGLFPRRVEVARRACEPAGRGVEADRRARSPVRPFIEQLRRLDPHDRRARRLRRVAGERVRRARWRLGPRSLREPIHRRAGRLSRRRHPRARGSSPSARGVTAPARRGGSPIRRVRSAALGRSGIARQTGRKKPPSGRRVRRCRASTLAPWFSSNRWTQQRSP